MIELHRINNASVYVNPDLIKYVEETPDTLLTFTDGKTLMVKEKPTEVCEKIKELKQRGTAWK